MSTTTARAQGWLCWFRCASAVFLLVVAGQDLRHLGRYDPKDSYCGMYKTGYAGCDALRAVSVSLVLRPMVLGIMDRYGPEGQLQWHVQDWYFSAVAVPRRSSTPFRAAETAVHGPALSEDRGEFAIAVHGDRCPHCAGRASSPFRRGSELLNMVAEVPVVQVEQVSLPCRDAEALFSWFSLSGGTIEISQFALRAGRSMSLLCRSSWFPGAVVEETAEISQLLLLRNRWLLVVLAALRGGVGMRRIFFGPCTQVQGRGSCPQGHGPP